MDINIRKGLLQFIFSGSYMKRWNDKLRPMELIEIDKQAHKMVVAWLLCQLEGESEDAATRLALEQAVVEGGIFDYFFRLTITDIKPPILYRIKENPEHYEQLVQWGLGQLEAQVAPVNGDFWERMKASLCTSRHEGKAAQILEFAHLYASVWEFRLLQKMNASFDDELEDIDKRFTSQLEKYEHLKGAPELIEGLAVMGNIPEKGEKPITNLAKFANLCGQLRFQKRWSQTPRIPETSVMGHMFIVACYAYMLSLALDCCPARRVNNFFCGLFHDLPELLTRDIISPVKKSFEGLDKLIKEYEEQELKRRIFEPLLSENRGYIVKRFRYFLGLDTGSEFNDTILRGNMVETVSFEDLHNKYNENSFDPKDGEAIKVCDKLSAYIEAYTAMRNGIASEQIQQAFWRMREQNANIKLGHFQVGALFTDFD